MPEVAETVPYTKIKSNTVNVSLAESKHGGLHVIPELVTHARYLARQDQRDMAVHDAPPIEE